MNNFILLAKLTEQDKRVIISLLIVFIVLFIVVAMIGNAIKLLAKNSGKRIDGYMTYLCENKEVTNSIQFRKQVFSKETRRLYHQIKWVMRFFVFSFILVLIYGVIVKTPGQNFHSFMTPFLKDLKMEFHTAKTTFFGIKNFPTSLPKITKGLNFTFSFPAIVTYYFLLSTIVTIIGISNSTFKFMARINRGFAKSNTVFNPSLDNVTFPQSYGKENE